MAEAIVGRLREGGKLSVLDHAAELRRRFQRTAVHPARHQQQADEGVERAEDEAGFAAQRFPDPTTEQAADQPAGTEADA